MSALHNPWFWLFAITAVILVVLAMFTYWAVIKTAAETVRTVRKVVAEHEQQRQQNKPDFPGRAEMQAEEDRLTAMQREMCHDERCPGRKARLLKHRCHDLSCAKHKHVARAR